MEQTLAELQSKYAYGIGKRLPSALRQSQASFIAIEPAGKDELALMRATHAEEMNTLRAQFRHVLSRAFCLPLLLLESSSAMLAGSKSFRGFNSSSSCTRNARGGVRSATEQKRLAENTALEKTVVQQVTSHA